jgi:glucose-1-phosphate thymidylyltransferase
MVERKGIILAGGTGSRLSPLTRAVSKQLLPVYDKPMIYYPLGVLMEAGITEIAVITTPEHQTAFQSCLRGSSTLGLDLTFIQQPRPEGLAQAYLLAEDFLAGAPSTLILGDNLFTGLGHTTALDRASARFKGAAIFARSVPDPQNYGVVGFDGLHRAVSIEEKPLSPASNFAITGLYFLDGSASERARDVRPSARGELEITCLLRSYLDDNNLHVENVDASCQWFDTGDPDRLLAASNHVAYEVAEGHSNPGCIEEIAFRKGLIDKATLLALARALGTTRYSTYLANVATAQAIDASPCLLEASA